jgi:hypothetical protein
VCIIIKSLSCISVCGLGMTIGRPAALDPFGPVRAVMFTQFEDVEGYVVAASDPPNVMTDQFKEIGYQFLPDKDICWRLISLCVGDLRIIGVPVHIDDAKYARRAFVFCFCLIVEKRAVQLAKIAAQKLAEVFYKLEIDSSYLSAPPSGHEDLVVFLKDLRECLNSEKVDSVNFEITNDVMIQFGKPRKSLENEQSNQMEIIQAWFFPVATVGVEQEPKLASGYDVVEVLRECSGELCVSELSVRLEIELKDLNRVLSLLYSRKLIVIIDQPIDRFTRVRLTRNFHSFFDDLSNRQAAVAFAAIPSGASGQSSLVNSAVSSPRAGPPVVVAPQGELGDQLVRMYCRLDSNVEDLGEFSAAEAGMAPNVSIRLLVIFGIIKNFIRTKIMFPVYPDYETTLIPVLRSCDGSRSWDEIGFKHGLNREELNELFTYHGVLRIWK